MAMGSSEEAEAPASPLRDPSITDALGVIISKSSKYTVKWALKILIARVEFELFKHTDKCSISSYNSSSRSCTSRLWVKSVDNYHSLHESQKGMSIYFADKNESCKLCSHDQMPRSSNLPISDRIPIKDKGTTPSAVVQEKSLQSINLMDKKLAGQGQFTYEISDSVNFKFRQFDCLEADSCKAMGSSEEAETLVSPLQDPTIADSLGVIISKSSKYAVTWALKNLIARIIIRHSHCLHFRMECQSFADKNGCCKLRAHDQMTGSSNLLISDRILIQNKLERRVNEVVDFQDGKKHGTGRQKAAGGMKDGQPPDLFRQFTVIIREVTSTSTSAMRRTNRPRHLSSNLMDKKLAGQGQLKYEICDSVNFEYMDKDQSTFLIDDEIDDHFYHSELVKSTSGVIFDEQMSTSNVTSTSTSATRRTNHPQALTSSEDMEFSWHNRTFHGQKTVPPVRTQVANSCVFYALCAGVEMEMKRAAALKAPSQRCQTTFLTRTFIHDYENISGTSADVLWKTRREEALKIFVKDGVRAKEGNGGKAPVHRIYISGYEWKPNIKFREACEIIRQGKPLIGSFPVDAQFHKLGIDEIYDSNPLEALMSDDGSPIAHVVVFIGFGMRSGKSYLVFLNSHGKRFGDKGYGRVYFKNVKKINTIEL